jgi:DME family drug/metabolite transporter
VVGVVVVLSPWTHVSSGDVEGAGLALLSAVFYAASVFIGKHLLERRRSIEVAAYPKFAAVAVTALGAAAFSGGLHVEFDALALLVVGSVVCGAVPLLTFYRGLSLLPASQASVLTLVEPLTAVIVGVVVWHEPLTAGIVVGGLLVAFAVVRVTRA